MQFLTGICNNRVIFINDPSYHIDKYQTFPGNRCDDYRENITGEREEKKSPGKGKKRKMRGSCNAGIVPDSAATTGLIRKVTMHKPEKRVLPFPGNRGTGEEKNRYITVFSIPLRKITQCADSRNTPVSGRL